VKVVNSLKSEEIIFLPDEYLARNVARETGRQFVLSSNVNSARELDEQDNTIRHEGGVLIGWRGRCEVHEKFTVQDIVTVRSQFPEVAILAHPECSPEVTGAADFSGSTNAMIKYVHETPAPQYLLLTECSMGDNIAAENPDKEMLRLCMVRCPHMNTITMEDTLDALKYNQYVVEVPEEIRVRAQHAVQRMIEIG